MVLMTMMYLRTHCLTPSRKIEPIQGVIYFGNDLNDLSSILLCGFSIVPCDAHPLIQKHADIVLPIKNGNGFVRSAIERILRVDRMDANSLAKSLTIPSLLFIMAIFIVAEIGINHNGDLSICKDLIDVAVQASCDAVKLQKRDIDLVYTQEFLDKPREVHGELHRGIKEGLKFDLNDYHEISEYCMSKGINGSHLHGI